MKVGAMSTYNWGELVKQPTYDSWDEPPSRLSPHGLRYWVIPEVINQPLLIIYMVDG